MGAEETQSMKGKTHRLRTYVAVVSNNSPHDRIHEQHRFHVLHNPKVRQSLEQGVDDVQDHGSPREIASLQKHQIVQEEPRLAIISVM